MVSDALMCIYMMYLQECMHAFIQQQAAGYRYAMSTLPDSRDVPLCLLFAHLL